MRLRHSLHFALALLAASASITTARAQRAEPRPSAAERAAVIAAAQSLFDGMRTRDTARLRAITAPELVFVATRVDSAGRPQIIRQRLDDFLPRIATSREELRERMWDPVVHVDGTIASVWAPYDFHIGEKFSHCGHDAFHLARTERGWIITAVTYTVQPTGCATGPR